MDEAAFEATLAAIADDRPGFAASVADAWFGNGLPGVSVSPGLQNWLIGLFLQASPRAAADMFRAFTHTDFRADMAAVMMPTLVVHGDSDTMAPFELSARKVAAAIPGSELKLYQNASHGLFISHRQRLSADLIEFIKR